MAKKKRKPKTGPGTGRCVMTVKLETRERVRTLQTALNGLSDESALDTPYVKKGKWSFDDVISYACIEAIEDMVASKLIKKPKS